MRAAPRSRRALVLVHAAFAAGFLVAGLLTAGCSEDGTGILDRPPDRRRVTTPESVLHDLENAYLERNLAAFDSLLFVPDPGDPGPGFEFRFWPTDVEEGRMPDSMWGRADEMAATAWMMNSAQIVEVEIDLRFAKSHAVSEPGHEGEREISDVTVDLRVEDRMPGEPMPFVYYVEGVQSFRFRPQRVSADGDTLWRIVSWSDLGHTATWGSQTSWGRLKWTWYTHSEQRAGARR